MRLEIKNGVYLFVVMGIYFLAVEALGFADSSTLRFFNAFAIAYFMNRSVVQRINRKQFGVLRQFGSAFLAGAFGIALSCFALFAYIGIFHDVSYINQLSEPLIGVNFDLTLTQYIFALFAEGLSIAVIVALILSQYWKNAKYTQPEISII
jgi:hypothetical protein